MSLWCLGAELAKGLKTILKEAMSHGLLPEEFVRLLRFITNALIRRCWEDFFEGATLQAINVILWKDPQLRPFNSVVFLRDFHLTIHFALRLI